MLQWRFTFTVALGVLAVCLSIGCGGSSEPTSADQAAPLPESESNHDLAPPDISIPAESSIEAGPGTGSEFDVPPDLGSQEAETKPSEPVESEFKLPPAQE